MPKKGDKPKYIAVNGDESEPGTFKDRYILERSPHMMLEGAAIAARAIDAHNIYVYVRGEFGLAYQRLATAIEEAYAAGIFGSNSMGTGYAIDCAVHRGAGAYICGEETAMLESIEGKKASHVSNRPSLPSKVFLRARRSSTTSSPSPRSLPSF